MSPVSVAGPIFSAHLIEEGLISTLRTWLPSYLADVAAQHGVGKIAPVKSWGLSSEYERWPEQGLPALIVACPGLRGEPEKTGDGFYRAIWSAEVSVTISARTGPAARKYAQIYAAAIRGAVLQRRSLGDGARVTTWLDEAYGDVAVEQRRTIVAAANVFAVEQNEVVSWRKGPGSDKPPIPTEWPEVTETEIETEIEE
jgi:hypothetical protein